MSNEVFVEFHSDADTTSRFENVFLSHDFLNLNPSPISGFEFTASSHSLGCGGVLHGSHGNISSPVAAEGASKYPNGAECVWEVRAEQGFHAVYEFYNRFDVETADSCRNDYVQVWPMFHHLLNREFNRS